MEVKIHETTIVKPSNPPFDHDHVRPLSHIDTDRNLNVSFRYLRAYVNTPSALAAGKDPFDVITSTLSTTLNHFYPYAGTLRHRDLDGRLEVFCTVGKGAPVVRATVDCTLESVKFLDDPAGQWIENLVPDPDTEAGLADPLIFQITVFSCGGFSLGAAVHHALCDGMGASVFFNGMAELARGATQLSVEPIWERTSMFGPRDPPRVEFPVQEILKLDNSFSPYLASGPVVRGCFHVKDKWLDRVKEFLLERSGSNYTTFEALGAFLWRARVKASRVPDDEEVKFAYSLSVRKLLKVPRGYWGNTCVPMFAKVCAKDLVEKPLWETAELIKKSKHNATEEYVRSFIDFQELNYAHGITAGRGVSGFTDWRHLGHSTVDFGWGGPVTVLPLTRNLLGSVEPCFFLPYSSVSGGEKDGFRVLVNLGEAAMPAFREEMDKFSRLEFE